MKVKDALLIGELANGTVIAGKRGITRDVLSVEVMEVPEVMSWATPGILVMTAFYSIKDSQDQQIEIVRALINKQAAGIIIKLGRFISEIPNEIILLANEHDFPIITIPKQVSYINILAPIYETLYKEKQLKEAKSQHPLYEVEDMTFSSLTNALDKIAEIVGCPVYIEDTAGLLLVTSNTFHSDGWRKSSFLFSKPDYSNYLKVIDTWLAEFSNKNYSVFNIPGLRNRMVLPLVWKNSIFAILHIPYVDKSMFIDVSPVHMEKIGNKLSQLFMGDQLYLQKNRLDDLELIDRHMLQFADINTKNVMSIVHFYADWLHKSNYPINHVIDYASLIRKKLYQLVNQLENCQPVIFEKYNKFYTFILCDEAVYTKMIRQWEFIIAQLQDENFHVSISPAIKNPTSFEEQVHAVTKTMEIGLKINPEDYVFTHDKLGIFEILLNLTTDPFVRSYTHNVLLPLKMEENDLITTLHVFLNENGNVSRASEQLFIHRRTMNYRLQKIQELLNMDINDATNRFILKFCLMIKDLM